MEGKAGHEMILARLQASEANASDGDVFPHRGKDLKLRIGEEGLQRALSARVPQVPAAEARAIARIDMSQSASFASPAKSESRFGSFWSSVRTRFDFAINLRSPPESIIRRSCRGVERPLRMVVPACLDQA